MACTKQGFLGLAGYYRCFVQNVGIIARPLTVLTKKYGFKMNEEAHTAFEKLKEALCSAPVLALPRFDKQLIVETDTCSRCIGGCVDARRSPSSVHNSSSTRKTTELINL